MPALVSSGVTAVPLQFFRARPTESDTVLLVSYLKDGHTTATAADAKTKWRQFCNTGVQCSFCASAEFAVQSPLEGVADL